LHGKPDWEQFEDKEPDWMDKPDDLSKVLEARKKKYGKY
jgi:hypothetical protein